MRSKYGKAYFIMFTDNNIASYLIINLCLFRRMDNLNNQNPEQIYQSPDRLAETPPPTYEESQESRERWTVNLPQDHYPGQPPPHYDEGEIVSTDASRPREQLKVNLHQNQDPAYRMSVVSFPTRRLDIQYKMFNMTAD